MPEITEQEQQLLEQYRRFGSPQDIQSRRIREAIASTGLITDRVEKLFNTLPADQYALVETDDGYAVQRGEETTPIKEFVLQEWSDFKDSLEKKDTSTQQGQPVAQVPYIRQSGDAQLQGKRKSVADDFIRVHYRNVPNTDSKAVN